MKVNGPNYLSDMRPDFSPREIDCGRLPAYQYQGNLTSELDSCNITPKDAIALFEDMLVIRELEEMELAGVAASAPGARANRFEHRAAAKLDWDRPQRAIMAELLLRGPQTIGELRGRASRMAAFESPPIVGNVLQSLAEHDPPWVVELPREPGRSATRWAHRLCPDSEAPPVSAAAGPAEPPTAATAAGPQTAELEQRITRLETTVQAVQEKLARLEAKVTSRLP